MPIQYDNQYANDFVASLRVDIGLAIDKNDVSRLAMLNQQALGAYHATADERFGHLANYAAECVRRIPTQTH